MTDFSYPETDNYRIIDGVKDVNGFEVYGVQNKQTGVIEYRDHLYPRVYQGIFDLQERYEEIVNGKGAAAVVPLEAVPTGESVQ